MRKTATNAINKTKVQMINNGSDELKVNLFVTIFFIPKLLFQRHHDKQSLGRLDS